MYSAVKCLRLFEVVFLVIQQRALKAFTISWVSLQIPQIFSKNKKVTLCAFPPLLRDCLSWFGIIISRWRQFSSSAGAAEEDGATRRRLSAVIRKTTIWHLCLFSWIRSGCSLLRPCSVYLCRHFSVSPCESFFSLLIRWSRFHCTDSYLPFINAPTFPPPPSRFHSVFLLKMCLKTGRWKPNFLLHWKWSNQWCPHKFF